MGFFIALLSALCFAGKDFLSKKLTHSLDGTTSTFASFAYALPFYVVILLVAHYAGYPLWIVPPGFYVLALLRAVSDSAAEWSKMHAFAAGDLSFVAPVLSLSPLFLLVLSPLITGDPLSAWGVAGVLCSVLGTITHLRGTLHVVGNRRAVLFSLAAALSFAFNACFDRLSAQHASPVYSGFIMTLFPCLFFAPMVLLYAKRRSALVADTVPLLGRGALEVLFMVSKLWALQYLSAPSVAVVTRLAMLISIVSGHFLLKEGDFTRRFISALLIVVGAALAIVGG